MKTEYNKLYETLYGNYSDKHVVRKNTFDSIDVNDNTCFVLNLENTHGTMFLFELDDIFHSTIEGMDEISAIHMNDINGVIVGLLDINKYPNILDIAYKFSLNRFIDIVKVYDSKGSNDLESILRFHYVIENFLIKPNTSKEILNLLTKYNIKTITYETLIKGW